MSLPSGLCSGSPSAPRTATARRAGINSSVAAVVDRSHVRRRLSPAGSRHELPCGPVLVVFADHAGCAWLRPLRRGFRHCFVVMRTGPVWLACEPLKDRIELDALAAPDDFDLAAFYCEQGHRVLLGQRLPARARRRFALAPLTCVTVVKRLLGIDAPWVWTPWQLYNHLSGPKGGFRPDSRSLQTPAPAASAGTFTLDSQVF
jgi:hypothetical protein